MDTSSSNALVNGQQAPQQPAQAGMEASLRSKVVEILSVTANGCLSELGYYPGMPRRLMEAEKRNTEWQTENVKLFQDNQKLVRALQLKTEHVSHFSTSDHEKVNKILGLEGQVRALQAEKGELIRMNEALASGGPNDSRYNALAADYQKLMAQYRGAMAEIHSLRSQLQAQSTHSRSASQPSIPRTSQLINPPSTAPVVTAGRHQLFSVPQGAVHGGIPMDQAGPIRRSSEPSNSYWNQAYSLTGTPRTGPISPENGFGLLPHFLQQTLGQVGSTDYQPTKENPYSPTDRTVPPTSIPQVPIVSTAVNRPPSATSVPTAQPFHTTPPPSNNHVPQPHTEQPHPPPPAHPSQLLQPSPPPINPLPADSSVAPQFPDTTRVSPKPPTPAEPVKSRTPSEPVEACTPADGPSTIPHVVSPPRESDALKRTNSTLSVASSDPVQESHKKARLEVPAQSGDNMEVVPNVVPKTEEAEDVREKEGDDDDDEEVVEVGPDGLRLVADCLSALLSDGTDGAELQTCLLCFARFKKGFAPEPPKSFAQTSEEDMVKHFTSEHSNAWDTLRRDV